MYRLIFFLFPLSLFGQNVMIGEWKDYHCYEGASFIAELDQKIYCVSNGGLFFVDKSDNSISRISKVTGLSDVNIKQVAYEEELNTLIIVYENCNIDLIINNQIINLSDIKRKDIQGLKKINNITLKDGVAYLSCSFGLVLIDLGKKEIKDTYNIGSLEKNLSINGCAFLQDSIIVATSEGLYFAYLTNPNLADYNNWFLFTDSLNYDNVLSYEGIIIADSSLDIISISYNNNSLLKSRFNSIEIIKDSFSFFLENENFQNIKYAWKDNDGFIWVADSVNGLLKFVDYEFIESFMPDGPASNSLYSLEFFNNKLYMAHGGHQNFSISNLNKNGISIKSFYDTWKNLDYSDLGNARDIIETAQLGDKTFLASWLNGIRVLENDVYVGNYEYENTGGVLDTIYYSNNVTQISDLKIDKNGNLWGLNNQVANPLFVKTIDNQWYSFSMNQNIQALFFDDMLIDSHNQKWGVIGRQRGLFVYSDNGTLSNHSDDEWRILDQTIGNGNLHTMGVLSIAEDLDGEIWVGTNEGICVFYSPELVFTNYNFDAQQILIQEGEYGQYLLYSEQIKCIAIDGANRKWVGTSNSGIYLLSDDGTEQIHHFTSQNSPLLSNTISDIAIDPISGEVFIGTDLGLISYRSDATTGSDFQGTATVFPNPVRESYRGLIAIKNLVTNARVKIVDLSGNLIFEDVAKGGQATWDGLDENGERVSTGVYLVFSSDINGVEKVVAKILLIR